MIYQALFVPLAWLGAALAVGCLSASAWAAPPTTQKTTAPFHELRANASDGLEQL